MPGAGLFTAFCSRLGGPASARGDPGSRTPEWDQEDPLYADGRPSRSLAGLMLQVLGTETVCDRDGHGQPGEDTEEDTHRHEP